MPLFLGDGTIHCKLRFLPSPLVLLLLQARRLEPWALAVALLLRATVALAVLVSSSPNLLVDLFRLGLPTGQEWPRAIAGSSVSAREPPENIAPRGSLRVSARGVPRDDDAQDLEGKTPRLASWIKEMLMAMAI